MLLKKMMGVVLLVGLLMGIFFWLPVVLSAGPTADLTVDTLVDEVDGSCSDGDCSLRDAVALVPAGGVIDFAELGSVSLDPALGSLVVTKDMTIEGRDDGLIRIHHDFEIVAEATVIMTDLTLSDSWYTDVPMIENAGHITLQRVEIAYATKPILYTTGTAIIDEALIHYYTEPIEVAPTGVLTLTNSLIEYGQAVEIINQGQVYIMDSTFRDEKGGIDNRDGGLLVMERVLFLYFDKGPLLYNHGAEAKVRMYDVRMRRNSSDGEPFILNEAGHIELENSLIFDNVGGSIINQDRFEIKNSTFTANEASVHIDNQALMTVTHSTWYGNEGMINNQESMGGRLWLGHTIMAKNENGSCQQGIMVISLGYNLIDEPYCGLTATGDFVDADIELVRLNNNSGTIITLALLPGSVAIGKGNCTEVTVDQRGAPRTMGRGCDIGAYEYDGPSTLMVRDDFYDMEVGTVLDRLLPGVGGNDSYVGDGHDRIMVVVPPAVGELDLRDDGGFTYTPPVDFEGVVNFKYRVVAEGQEDIGKVTIEVRGDVCHTTIDDGGTVWSSWDATALKMAVEAVPAGGVVKIAGRCRGQGRLYASNVAALVYGQKSFSLQGGYRLNDWLNAYPEMQPTVVDAANEGTVVHIMGDGSHPIVIDGVHVIGGDGGGAWLANGGNDVLVRRSYFEHNEGGLAGGMAVMTATMVIVEETVVADNASRYDGGLLFEFDVDAVVISNSMILSNTGFLAGGLTNHASSLRIANSVIANNQSIDPLNEGLGYRSGGLVNSRYGEAIDGLIINSTISGNFIDLAYYYGAAITQGVANFDARLAIQNSTIAYNQTEYGYGGIFIRTWGGFEPGLIILTNNIIAYNTGEQCNSADYFRTNNYNIATDNSCHLTGVYDQPNTDPLLGPLLASGVTAAGGVAWTHYLPGSSPARNGIPVGVNGCGAEGDRDQRGMTRPLEGACDMGAHEMGRPTLGIVDDDMAWVAAATAVIGLDLAYGIDVPITVNYELMGGT
ncbi:MAG TPA: choice-of-anchor Q domain-containing protein, partial [Anaerolineae bacterium]|nr:choice-of-anchor Q domain-containing protein [Anaerolineae bacterium]